MKLAALRGRLSTVAHLDLELHRTDVFTAFLNGELPADIFTEQPDGFADTLNCDWQGKLQKALYGLKRVPSKRHEMMDQFFVG